MNNNIYEKLKFWNYNSSSITIEVMSLTILKRIYSEKNRIETEFRH